MRQQSTALMGMSGPPSNCFPASWYARIVNPSSAPARKHSTGRTARKRNMFPIPVGNIPGLAGASAPPTGYTK